MQARLYRLFWRSLLLAIASAMAAYAFIWGLVTTHPELEIASDAALSLAIYIFPIALLAGIAIDVRKRMGPRRH